MPKNNEFTVNFQPIGIRLITNADISLLSSAQTAGISIASICGGVGICDSCKVRLIEGKLTDPSLEEIELFTDSELASGFRLACQSYPQSDLIIEIPPESLTASQRLQVEGEDITIELHPPVVPVELQIMEPTIFDLKSDTVRVREALLQSGLSEEVIFELPVLEHLSPQLRKNNWHINVAMRSNSVVAILPIDAPILGLAVDVGTTKLAAYLCNLQTGSILAKSGAMNPQTAFGEDVISRISYSNSVQNGNKILQSRLVDTLNNLIKELCDLARKKYTNVSQDQIVEAVVVGNTAMHHLFAGLPVWQLGVAPYVPAVSESIEFNAKEIELAISPGAKVYLPPNIAGYVGADHVAMLLSTDLANKTNTTIALDIGTNTEITLFHNQHLFSCSCASGPAFEGAHILMGMRAAPGAIERVQVIHDELRVQTIDNMDSIGICGSGILDAIACLLDIGAIDRRGSFVSSHPMIRQADKMKEIVLVPANKSGNGKDIVITRQDVNEIQLAKGAIRTGIEVLLECAGISAEDVQEFIIAGAFGTYINIPSAIKIGMFPDLPLQRFRQVGNAAGAGARQMLLSTNLREIAEEVSKRTQYIELSTYPDFTTIFSKSLFL